MLRPGFDSDKEDLLFKPLPVSVHRCCQQHPFCWTKKEEEQKLPVTKHNADCCALLFLTLQLHSNPQITLMGRHESGRQHIKWLKLMEIPHVQRRISREQLLFSTRDGTQEGQRVLFYHVWKFSRDLKSRGTHSVIIKRLTGVFFIDQKKKKRNPPSSRLNLHVIMCNFNHAQNILIAYPSSHKQ